MLRINSLTPEQGKVINNEKTYLSTDDCLGLQSFMKEFMFKYVIPHLEGRLQTLEEQVAITRKNMFTTKVKRLFGFSSKPRTTGEVGAPEITSSGARIYAVRTPTAQTRQLADIAFMIRDYDSALLNYKNCIPEMKNDQTLKYLAGVTEMVGICQSFLDQNKRASSDSEQEFERALGLYQETKSFRYSVRVIFLLTALKKIKNKFGDAALLLTRLDNKNNLLTALFQEQSAFCYLFKSPPMYRMFSMRLVMAADKYYEAGQLEHSIGCAIAALPNYKGKDWGLLVDHIQFIISRASFLLGDLKTSAFYSTAILEHSTQSPERQSSYLRELLHIYSLSYENDRIVREAPVPKIHGESLNIVLQTSYASQEEKLWKLLEDWVVYEIPREKARSEFRHFGVPRTPVPFKHSVSPIDGLSFLFLSLTSSLPLFPFPPSFLPSFHSRCIFAFIFMKA